MSTISKGIIGIALLLFVVTMAITSAPTSLASEIDQAVPRITVTVVGKELKCNIRFPDGCVVDDSCDKLAPVTVAGKTPLESLHAERCDTK